MQYFTVALCLAGALFACPGRQVRPGGLEGETGVATPDAAGPARGRGVASAPSAVAEILEESLLLPGEFEPAERMLLVWDDYFADFLLDIMVAVWGEVAITVVVDSDRPSEELERAALDPRRVQVVRMPVGSIWIRDFGPLVVRGSEGRRHIVDFDYESAGEEDDLPLRLGAQLWRDWPHHQAGIEFEGGNVLADGEGRCITTAVHGDIADLLDEDEPVHSLIDVDALRSVLRAKLGCRELFVVPRLHGEPTGHVDMFATVTGPGEVIVGRYDADVDAVNARRLDRVAAMLRDGGFLVRRVPMPGHDDGKFRSYTNALAVNRVVLVPVYPEHADGEDEALAVFADAYPGRRIVPIVASQVIELEGAVHCATMTIAAQVSRVAGAVTE